MEKILRFLDSKEKKETKEEEIKCKCCRKIINQIAKNQLYCSACAVYHKDLLYSLGHFKNKAIALNKFIYGQGSGSQRLRFDGSYISPAIQVAYDKGFQDGVESQKK
jgi:hypothetical protein